MNISERNKLLKKILFVCLGNICRSPMAEFIFRDMVKKRGLENEFSCASAATSTEEWGNPVHPGTRRKLAELGIRCDGKKARPIEKKDYKEYDLLIGMESRNVQNMKRILGGDPEGKILRLLDYSDRPRDIADPWYTGNFDITCNDILEGCEALLDHLIKQA